MLNKLLKVFKASKTIDNFQMCVFQLKAVRVALRSVELYKFGKVKPLIAKLRHVAITLKNQKIRNMNAWGFIFEDRRWPNSIFFILFLQNCSLIVRKSQKLKQRSDCKKLSALDCRKMWFVLFFINNGLKVFEDFVSLKISNLKISKIEKIWKC